MSAQEIVHVVIPVFNVKQYLDECVASVLEQTYSELDVILVDDGSTDGSQHLCDDWAARDSRVRVIHQRNQGLSSARNTALDLIQDGYVLCVDSDDCLMSKDMLSSLVHSMRQYKQDIAYFGYYVGESKAGSKQVPICDSPIVDTALLYLISSGRLQNYAWHFLAKAVLYNNVRFPYGRKAEDLATTYKILANAGHGLLVPNCYYFYRQRQGSIVHAIDDDGVISYYKDELLGFHEMIQFLRDHDHKAYIFSCNTLLRQFFAHLGFAQTSRTIQWLNQCLIEECRLIPWDSIDNANRFKIALLHLRIFRLVFRAHMSVKNVLLLGR